jgi:hypothetical protein
LLVVEATLQLSAVVGVPSDGIVALQDPASALIFTEGGHVILGFWVSVTVMICVQVAVFPLASVTVKVTVVEPVG